MAILRVITDDGLIAGLACNNHDISIFKGIPFAAPPVGNLRWKSPQPVQPWTNVLQAYSYKSIPIQDIAGDEARCYGADIWPSSEDCLYLNVWTPALSDKDRLPVVIWVYGGSYKSGSSTNKLIDGEAFAKRGCVFVSFNYRCGPMGFLAHPELSAESEHGVSSNYGTEDQISALKWVNKNIASFGGDPNQVTLIGQSAGAHSVMTLCNSPLSADLIQRAIIQSTGGLSAMYYQDEQTLADAEQEGIQMLQKLGVSTIAEARQLDAMEITKKLVNVKISTKAPWFPKTDGYVLPLGTITSIMTNHQAKISYLSGSTSYESGCMPPFLSDNSAKTPLFANMCFPDAVDDYLATIDQSNSDCIRQAIFDQYSNDKLCAVIGWQELEIARGGDNFYQYFYTKDQPGVDHHGACHGSELPYVFQTMQNDVRPYDGSDFDLSNLICSYWTNFIKTGNPNGDGLPQWRKYSVRNREALELGNHVGMIKVPWDNNKSFVVKYMLNQANKLSKSEIKI